MASVSLAGAAFHTRVHFQLALLQKGAEDPFEIRVDALHPTIL